METRPPPAPQPAQKLISPFARAMRNAGYLLGGSSASAVFGFLTTILAARQLGLRDFGILLLIHSFTGALAVGTRLQSWQPILQFGTILYETGERPRFQALLRHCLLLDMSGACVAVIIGVPMSLICSHWLGWGGYEKPAAFYVTCALFMNTGATIGIMRLADRYKMAAMADGSGALVRFIGAATGLLLHWQLPAFLVIWYLSIVTAFAVDGWFLWRLTRVLPSLHGFQLRGGPWRSQEPGFWKLLLPASADQILIGLAGRLDLLLVGGLLGSGDAALYRVATQIGEAFVQPAQLLNPALYPEFVRLREQKDWQALRGIVWRILRWLTSFSAVTLVTVFFIGPRILSLMLGRDIYDTRPLLLWMTMASVVCLWNVPLEPLLVSLGRAKALLHGRLLILLLFLPLIYILVQLFGMNGAAIAAFIRESGIFLTRLLLFLSVL